MPTSLRQICDQLAAWLAGTDPPNPDWSPETWQTFRYVALVHGVGPLLHRRIGRAAWLPEGTRAWLAEQHAYNVRRISRMHGELQAILHRFAQAGLPVMPLKGSILSAQVYPQPGLRPMADLDLLVRPADLPRCAALLADLGYQQETVHWKHTEFIKPDNRAVASPTCEHPDNPRGIEVHAHCRETFGGPTIELTDRMWRSARPGTLLAAPAILPDDDALWLHLLIHGSYHIWQERGRLIHLVDLAYLTPRLADPAAALAGVDARYTYPALALAHTCFPEAIPDSLRRAQAARLPTHFRAWADGRDLVNSSYLNPDPAGLYFFKALRFAGGRPGEILQALRYSFLPSPEELALDHPRLARSPVPWLAYFLLPLDWGKRLIRR